MPSSRSKIKRSEGMIGKDRSLVDGDNDDVCADHSWGEGAKNRDSPQSNEVR